MERCSNKSKDRLSKTNGVTHDKSKNTMTCEQCDHDPCECEDWILKQDYHDNDNNENEKE